MATYMQMTFWPFWFRMVSTATAVADDQFTLAAADGEHTVDGQYSRAEGGIYGLAVDNRGGGSFDGHICLCSDGAAAVHGRAERVDNPAYHGVTCGHTRSLSRAVDGRAGLHLPVVAEQYAPDAFGRELLNHALEPAFKLQYLAVFGEVEAADFGYSVADGQHFARLARDGRHRPALYCLPEVIDCLAQKGRYAARAVLYILFEALYSALGRPVVDVVTVFEAEAADNGRVFYNFNYGADAVGALQKIPKALELALIRGRYAI